MASSSVILSEEQIQCSICLDVFTKPVSTPCGHSFCMTCLTGYWDSSDQYHCPICKEEFNTRPELRVNIFIAEMAAQLKKLGPAEVTTITPKSIKPGLVPCDVCSGTKLNAVKSCLVCLASYCETHLEPHQILATFKKHKLIDPVENLEDRVCKKHERPLEMFCREDQTCVCQFCTEGDHRDHETVPIEEEFRVRQSQLGLTRSEVQKMIQERQEKVKEIQLSGVNSKTRAEKEIAETKHVFSALMHSIERRQDELIEVIEGKQRVVEKMTAEIIQDLEKEIIDLQKKSADLELLSHTEDHLNLFQSSPTLSTLPHSKDWSGIKADSDLCVDPVWRTLCQLERTLHKEMEKLADVKLREMKKCAMDVTLDPDTAHPELILSKDGKEVRSGERDPNIHANPKRFSNNACVLGKQGRSSGKFYYEVQVRDKTDWVLGIARESIIRNAPLLRNPTEGHWAIGLWGEAGYQAHAGPDVVLSLRQKPEKVGVFVDYEEGEVSFYDVEAKSCIYSFTGCSFTERLFPCFSAGVNVGGKNSAPLIICPVNKIN